MSLEAITDCLGVITVSFGTSTGCLGAFIRASAGIIGGLGASAVMGLFDRERARPNGRQAVPRDGFPDFLSPRRRRRPFCRPIHIVVIVPYCHCGSTESSLTPSGEGMDTPTAILSRRRAVLGPA